MPIDADGRKEVLPLLEENARRNVGKVVHLSSPFSGDYPQNYPRKG